MGNHHFYFFGDFKPCYLKAKELANKYHQDQKYGDRPYITHFEHVEKVLGRFGFSPDDPDMNSATLGKLLYISAWLHDIIEDTPFTYDNLTGHFGLEIGKLVFAVTSEPGKNRKERNAKTYPKIKGDFSATALKLADRIANVESSLISFALGHDSKLKMYVKEWEGFKKGIKIDGELDGMWNYLERLLSDVEFSKQRTIDLLNENNST